MHRLVTNPNSKIDKNILRALYLVIFICVDCFTYNVITTWYKWLIFEIIIASVISILIELLYFIKYSKNILEMRLKAKIADFLCVPGLGCYDIPKACKLIDEICNATIVPIEERKFLYDQMCTIWTIYGGCSNYKVYSVPGFITEKWKKAIIEYKKYEIENY